MNRLRLIVLAALPIALPAQAQFVDWKGGTGTNLWSNGDNWNPEGAGPPSGNSDDARFNLESGVQINVDGDFTVRSYQVGFSGNPTSMDTHLLFGANTLTIDINNASNAAGLKNATQFGKTLRFNCDLNISNSLSGITLVRNENNAANVLRFDSNCDLTLTTLLRTDSSLGTIDFNCNFSPSSQNLIIGSDNVSFGPDHSSANFGRDIVLLSNSKLSVNGGTVLTDFRKFQVNGADATLELNAADTINGANVIIGGSNSLTLDANASQATMGVVNINNGTLTINVHSAVSNLAFKKSAAQAWGSGSITINGFKENTIRFGTDDTGLTGGQLAAIDGGAYFLTPDGFLTTGLITPTLSIALNENDQPEITFTTVIGQSYQLQKSGDGALGDWQDVIGQSVVGDDTEKTLIDTDGGPPGETRAFYRVETE